MIPLRNGRNCWGKKKNVRNSNKDIFSRFFKLFPTDADFYRYFINGQRGGGEGKPDFMLHERKRLVTKRDVALENSARGSIRGMFRLLWRCPMESDQIFAELDRQYRAQRYSPSVPPSAPLVRARARLYIYFLIIDTNPTTDYVLWVDERLTVGLMKFHTGTPSFLTYADFASCRINMLLIVNTGFTGAGRGEGGGPGVALWRTADLAITAARIQWYHGSTACQ